MTTPNQKRKDGVQWLIDNAKPDQLDRLLTDIEACGCPKQPNHFGTKAIQ